MEEQIEARRIREGDCLSACLTDLERAARDVRPWDADGWARWISACADLLAAVPDSMQRMAWAWSLEQALSRHLVGLPAGMVSGLLLTRATDQLGNPAEGAR